MNELKGTVLDVATEQHLSLVHLSVYDDRMTSIVLETPATAPYLREGSTVKILFKETEVIVAREPLPLISLRNRLACRIVDLQKGLLLSRLVLDYHNEQLVSVITSSAVDQLALRAGDHVVAMIKTNEVMLAL